MQFAVNGTLMRGCSLNATLLVAGATFTCDARTAPLYRLWSVGDLYPAMLRANEGGAAIDLELWEVSAMGIVQVLECEPPGLTVGKVRLENDRDVLGVVGEYWVTMGQREITQYGGWRPYLRAIQGTGLGTSP